MSLARPRQIAAALPLWVLAQACQADIGSCSDGNICHLDNPEYTGPVRIFCIQAPHLNEPWGMQARDTLRAEVRGTIRVLMDHVNEQNLPVAELIREDGHNLGLELVRQGLARVMPKFCDDPLYPIAENEARQERLGIWSGK